MGKNKDHEQLEALDAFIGDGTIDDVVGIVKSGKEATVYCCTSSARGVPPLVAAKVYRSTDVRRFANDAAYREGRLRRKDRVARAIESKTRAGREFAFSQWVGAEHEALQLLHTAGVRVPRPLARSDSVVVMEYIGDQEGPAPLLNHAQMERDEAAEACAALLRDIETMLSCDRVHGDLSSFNVLYWNGAPVIIDFPQAVDARFNSNALALLERDVDRICGFFERYGIGNDAGRLARALWGRFLRSEL